MLTNIINNVTIMVDGAPFLMGMVTGVMLIVIIDVVLVTFTKYVRIG